MRYLHTSRAASSSLSRVIGIGNGAIIVNWWYRRMMDSLLFLSLAEARSVVIRTYLLRKVYYSVLNLCHLSCAYSSIYERQHQELRNGPVSFLCTGQINHAWTIMLVVAYFRFGVRFHFLVIFVSNEWCVLVVRFIYFLGIHLQFILENFRNYHCQNINHQQLNSSLQDVCKNSLGLIINYVDSKESLWGRRGEVWDDQKCVDKFYGHYDMNIMLLHRVVQWQSMATILQATRYKARLFQHCSLKL